MKITFEENYRISGLVICYRIIGENGYMGGFVTVDKHGVFFEPDGGTYSADEMIAIAEAMKELA